MSKRYYVDACIWRDYAENRVDKFRPLGEWAFKFLKMVVDEDSIIIYSNFVLDELGKKYDDGEINELFSIIFKPQLLLRIDITEAQIKSSLILSRINNTPFVDTLHAVAARDAGAVLITRDRHFEGLQHLVEVRKPEELI